MCFSGWGGALASENQAEEERSSIWATNNPDGVEGPHSRMRSLAAKKVLLTVMGKTPEATLSEISPFWQVVSVKQPSQVMASSSLSGWNLSHALLCPQRPQRICLCVLPGASDQVSLYIHPSGFDSVEPNCTYLFPAGFGEGSVPKDLNQGGNIWIHLNGLFH